jgi:diadenylate cyclase
MLGKFFEFLSSLTIIDYIDVLIVAILIYNLLTLFKGTRTVQIISGFIIILGIFLMSDICNLRTLNWLLRYFFIYAGLIIIVLFHPEIRHLLSTISRNPILRAFNKAPRLHETMDDLVFAMNAMSEKRIGGIILLEKNVGLRNYIEAGIRVDGIVSYDLLLSIFHPTSPLHDGAVIIRGDRILAAACFLPLTLNPKLSRELGSRHRAAIGVSEESDAIALIVSEERGEISLAYHGKITKSIPIKNLAKIIATLQEETEEAQELMKRYRRQFTKIIEEEEAQE